jgi:hypothetical protein
LTLYKDVTKSESVATATATALGVATVSQSNSSGLSGNVNLNTYSADDNSIEIVCFLSKDTDLQLANLSTLRDYDPVVGFAKFHLDAWEYFKEFVVSRYKSLVWNPNFIDTRQLNGATGGYDLGRVMNWTALREAAAHYALWHICERVALEDNNFARRADTSKSMVRAHLSTVELIFDTNNDRVENKSRSFSAWRINRA